MPHPSTYWPNFLGRITKNFGTWGQNSKFSTQKYFLPQANIFSFIKIYYQSVEYFRIVEKAYQFKRRMRQAYISCKE
jgi:hypothetical protein